MIRFKTHFGTGEETIAIGPKQNNGDFDWYPVLTTKCLQDYSDFKEKWLVQLVAVSPDQAGSKGIEEAIGCCGYEDEEAAGPLAAVVALAEYGISAPIYEATGNNLRTLRKQAHEQAAIACMLAGFVFDRAVNAVGATGWDAIRGELYPRPAGAEGEEE